MSPLPTSTPCAAAAASRSSGVMTSPACIQSTPLSRAMSSSTPRPTMPLAILSIEQCIAPFGPTSLAGKPLYSWSS